MKTDRNSTNIFQPILYCFFALLIFIACFVKVSPSLNADDSPETVTAQQTLGLQHPPGYPLNTLAGKIFDLLPLGGLMFRSNLMALFFHIMTALLLFALARKHLRVFENFNLLFAFLLAVIYFFCSTPFLQASSAKGSIYTMNAFFTVLLFMSLFNIKNDGKYFYLSCFIYGLSMGNHWPSMLILLPAVLLYLFLEKKHISPRAALGGVAFFLLGTSVYLYVVIRAAGSPVYWWGEAKSLKDVFWLITMRHYKPDIVNHGAGFSWELWAFYLKDLLTRQYFGFLAAFSIPGVYFLFKKTRSKSFVFVAAYVCLTAGILISSAPLVFQGTMWVMKPLLTSSYVLMSVFIAAGICMILDKLPGMPRAINTSAQVSSAVAVFLVLFAVSPDYSRYYLVYDYMNNTAKSLPQKAVYFSEGEMNGFGSDYLRFVEKKDFVPVSTFLLASGWYRERLKIIFNGSLDVPAKETKGSEYLGDIMLLNRDRGVYYSGEYTREWQSYGFVPCGIINKVMLDGKAGEPEPGLLQMYSYRGVYDKSFAYDEFGSYMVVKPYGIRIRSYGDLHLGKKDYANALNFYRKSLYFYEDDYVYNAMGSCFYYLGDFSGASTMFKKALKLNVNNVDSDVYLALMTAAQKDYTMAAEYFNRALLIKPNDHAIMQLKAQALNKNK